MTNEKVKAGRLNLMYLPYAARDQRRGSVYFIACDNRFVKVGFTENVDARLADLQVGCPFELRVLGAMPDIHEEVERWFHAVLRFEHVRGEWFNLTDPIRLLIQRVNEGARPVDALDVGRIYGSCPPRRGGRG